MSGPDDSSGLVTVGPAATVGVISDTHGHLYPEVRSALLGVDHIVHAGDVGSQQILAELRTIAPVIAVRGNCDYDAWASILPMRAELTIAGARLVIGHVGRQVQEWAEAVQKTTPATGRIDAVIFGHSHQPLVERRSDMLYLNPGSAGPRRFNRPRTLAKLVIRAAPGDGAGRPALEVEIIEID